MTDVDAARFLASEHDLEFVDLDSYSVDPVAVAILPAAIARRHKVIAVKRKFGTPVVAISNPDDVFALDTLRASIGRDFISVVAAPDQIDEYLDKFYGNVDRAAPATAAAPAPASAPAPEEDVLPPPPPPVKAPKAKPAKPAPQPAAAKDDDWQDLMEEPISDSGGEKVTPKAKATKRAPETPVVAVEAETEAPPPPPTPIKAPVSVHDEEPAPTTQTLDLDDLLPDAPAPLAAPIPGDASDGGPRAIGFDPVIPGLPDSTQAFEAAVDELAAFTEATRQPNAHDDSGATAVDLVDEAVATFEEQQGAESTGRRESLSGLPMLAQVLLEGGRVGEDDMEAANEEAAATGVSIARVLTERGLVGEADLMWAMATEMGLDFVDLDSSGVDLGAAIMLPENTARHHTVLCIARDESGLVVATANPTDVFALDDIRSVLGSRFRLVVATRAQIVDHIGKSFGTGGDASDLASEVSQGFADRDEGPEDIQAITDDAPIVRYVNLLILQALNERASDIHVEPSATDLRIRYRIDGVLHDASSAPRSISGAVTTRLKVMADMNIAEHRVPQDGRISLNVGAKAVDLRMATLPTIHGEKIVMRVLDKSSVVLGFSDLGFDDDLLETYEAMFTKPYGTILVTGPTGSGKSTTLYTTLSALNSPEKNIITVEDPVELQIGGINQVQLNVKAGLTFASALKSILRSDPDIVLVGEIRDEETAIIAIEAALTGHLVLATLHTNSAASTPMRLIEMGLQPFLVTSALSGVLAQRLARRLCDHCKEPFDATEAEIVASGWTLQEVEEVGKLDKLYRAIGCPACSNTGYRGRKALAELMPCTEEIERMIIEGGSVDDIHRIAVSQGMVTLRQSGLRKALSGETTLEEVLRVVA